MTSTATDLDALVSFENDLEASTSEGEDNQYTGDVVESLAEAGIRSEEASSLARPWMKCHRFELVTSADRVREIVDQGIEVGRIALDLETEGLDNRINYDAEGKPSTEHKIVGYCLGLQGTGYYVPVRHVCDKYDRNPNVDSVEKAEAEITRLCQAAQPVLKPGADILGARERDFEVPPKVVIEFWHAKFDQEFLYPVTGIDIWNPHSFEDGMLMAYVLYTDDDLGLKENARDKLPPAGGEHRYEMIEFTKLFPPGMKKRDRKFANLVPSEGSDVVYYGCSDGICTNLLCGFLLPKVNANPRFKSFYRLEKQDVQAVRLVERPRVLINKKEIDVLLQEAETELAHYETQIKQVAATFGFDADFNPSSSGQLAELLFSPKGLDLNPKPEKTAEGQYKTDEKTIDAYVEEHAERMPVLGHIVKHRQINKVRGTYLKNLAENTDDHDQLRLNFKQTGAATGRFTAPKGDPSQGFGGIPIQGIPARDDPKKPKVAHSLRRMFISRPGYVFVKVDYASQELRIAASVSGEEKWIKEYEKEAITGEPADLHMMTAMAFFPGLTKDSPDVKLKRNAGKTANFALVYGGGVGAVQRATGADEVEAARQKKAFDDSVPQFSKWVKKQHAYVKANLGVETAFHRFIAIPDAMITADEVNRRRREKGKDELPKFVAAKEAKKIQAACERKATNFPIQGSGADILKISLVLLVREFMLRGWLKNGGDDSVRMVMTVHDEIVFEVREERVAEAVPVIVKIMESPYKLAGWRIPLIAEPDLGTSWAAKINWHKMLKGEQERPAYLQGVEITSDPDVIVLRSDPQKGPPSTPPAPKATPAASPAAAKPKPVNGSNGHTAVAPATTEARASRAPGRFLSVRLKMIHVDHPTVCNIARACTDARIEAYKHGRGDVMVPVEFLLGTGQVVYSRKQGYKVEPEELVAGLRRLNLLEAYDMKDNYE